MNEDDRAAVLSKFPHAGNDKFIIERPGGGMRVVCLPPPIPGRDLFEEGTAGEWMDHFIKMIGDRPGLVGELRVAARIEEMHVFDWIFATLAARFDELVQEVNGMPATPKGAAH